MRVMLSSLLVSSSSDRIRVGEGCRAENAVERVVAASRSEGPVFLCALASFWSSVDGGGGVADAFCRWRGNEGPALGNGLD